MKTETAPIYFLTSHDTGEDIHWFRTFDKNLIYHTIKRYLMDNLTDTITLERDLTIAERKKYAGRHIIDFFRHDGKDGICKIIIKGNKEYMKKVNVPELKIYGQESWDDDPIGAYLSTYG